MYVGSPKLDRHPVNIINWKRHPDYKTGSICVGCVLFINPVV